jgi:type IX secretion system PorP/SprF family membrane protein
MRNQEKGSKGLFVLLLCLAILGNIAFAQDVHLSQFFNTPLLRNPALAGIFTGDIRIQSVYRSQWQSIGFPYRTTALSGEYKFGVGQGDNFITTGASFFHDQAGVMKLTTTQVMPVINFHKSLHAEKNRYLSAGFMAGMVQRQFDGRALSFDNQYSAGRYDPTASTGEDFTGLNHRFADFGVGISYNSEVGVLGNYFIGASYWHFNKPKANFLTQSVQLNPKWQMNAGLRIPLNERVLLQVEANHLMQGEYKETIGGGMLSYVFTESTQDGAQGLNQFQVGAGLFMRFQDAIIPQVMLTYNHFDLGVSYDINISQLSVASRGRGGYEFSLSYRAFARPQSINYMKCPRF